MLTNEKNLFPLQQSNLKDEKRGHVVASLSIRTAQQCDTVAYLACSVALI